MTDEAELKVASDTFLARLDRLHGLEEQKRLLTPGTEPMIGLASEIEQMAREILGLAETQQELARGAAEVPGMRPIDAIPPRDASEILADWRAAERRLTDPSAGPTEVALAQADIERLRNEYRQVFSARMGDRSGEPEA